MTLTRYSFIKQYLSHILYVNIRVNLVKDLLAHFHSESPRQLQRRPVFTSYFLGDFRFLFVFSLIRLSKYFLAWSKDSKVDSQRFWDQMDELPVSAIPKIEEEIVKRVIEIEGISLDTLLLDATNFFAFINTTNNRCSLAQRGKISHMREKTLDLPDIRDIF